MPGFMEGFGNATAGMDIVQQGIDRGKQSALAGLAGQYAAGGQPDYQGIARNGGDPMAFRNDQQKQQDMQEQQIGKIAGYLASIPDAAQRNAAYQQVKPRIATFAQAKGFPVPENLDDSHLPELQYIAQAWGGVNDQQNQLPAEARTALFFQQHPDLAAQEQERYKNRPFYNSQDNTLIYPKGPSQVGPAPMPQQGPQRTITSLDDATMQAIMAAPPSERPAMFQAIFTGGTFHQTPDGGAAPGLSGGQTFETSPPAPPQRGPGSVQVGPGAADRANAVARATEQAKIDATLANAPAVNANDAANAAAKAQAESDVKRGADLREAMPKARLALSSAKTKAANVYRAIDSAIPLVGVWTAGTVGRPLSTLGGTAAANLRANIDTLEANLAFNELQQMRASSPTGGALGSITEKELELLGSTIASLKQSQSPAQLASNLKFVKQQYAKTLAQMEKDFEADYGGGKAQAGTATGFPKAGAVENGYRFKGGNPADPNSWERAQ